jgi:protocatechuate 3,4-dioxygenase alpha subunit
VGSALVRTNSCFAGLREQRGGEVVYRFDIHLQGEDETVFFDV